ncbi:hypothetical protein H0H92_007073, partial [Tricholoma furcatifolium]
MIHRLTRLLPKFRGQKSRVRCFLHILNLVAKVILRHFDNTKDEETQLDIQELLEDNKWENDEEEDDNDEDGDVDDIENEDDGGDVTPIRQVLNKLRRLSFAIKNSSTLLLPEWFKILERMNLSAQMLPRDVKTHWNSTYDMLKAALQYRTAVDELTGNRKHDLRKYELEEEEWVLAAQLTTVLETFKEATLAFSKSTSTIAKVLPSMDKISRLLDPSAKETANFCPAIKAALRCGASLLAQYRELIDTSDIYRIAT